MLADLPRRSREESRSALLEPEEFAEGGAVQRPARGLGWAALLDGDERHPVVAEGGAADGQPFGVVSVEVVGQGFVPPPADAARVGGCPAVQPVAQGDPTRRPARPAVDQAEMEEEVLLVDRVVGAGICLVGAEPRPGLPLAMGAVP